MVGVTLTSQWLEGTDKKRSGRLNVPNSFWWVSKIRDQHRTIYICRIFVIQIIRWWIVWCCGDCSLSEINRDHNLCLSSSVTGSDVSCLCGMMIRSQRKKDLRGASRAVIEICILLNMNNDRVAFFLRVSTYFIISYPFSETTIRGRGWQIFSAWDTRKKSAVSPGHNLKKTCHALQKVDFW